MRVLAIDTSSRVLSIAIVEEKEVIISTDWLVERRHSCELLPLLQQILHISTITLKDIDGFAVGVGPGSFTGLRVGIAVIKGLSVACKKRVIGIPSLDALAENVVYFDGQICPVIDAKRKQVYTSIYKREEAQLKRLTDYLLISPAEIVGMVDTPAIFLGDGVELSFFPEGKDAIYLADSSLWYPRASIIGRLAIERLKEGREDDLSNLTPIYLYPQDCQVPRKDGESKIENT